MQNSGTNCLNEENTEEAQILKSNQNFLKHALNGFLRLMILWIISKNPSIHGYGIMKKIDSFFKEDIDSGLMNKLSSSKIYPILQKMEQYQIIEGKWKTHNNKKVKFYKISPKGEKLLNTARKKGHELRNNQKWTEFIDDMTIN